MEQEQEREPTQAQKMLGKLKEHPLIPIGMLATCGALGMAFRRMHQRDSDGYQRWLRARVLAQGFTILAIVVAGMHEFGPFKDRGKEEVKSGEGFGVGKTVLASEQRAFERRLKDAEEAHEAEVRVGNIKANTTALTPADLQRQPSIPHSKPTGERTPTRTSSWLSWLGLSKS